MDTSTLTQPGFTQTAIESYRDGLLNAADSGWPVDPERATWQQGLHDGFDGYWLGEPTDEAIEARLIETGMTD